MKQKRYAKHTPQQLNRTRNILSKDELTISSHLAKLADLKHAYKSAALPTFYMYV